MSFLNDNVEYLYNLTFSRINIYLWLLLILWNTYQIMLQYHFCNSVYFLCLSTHQACLQHIVWWTKYIYYSLNTHIYVYIYIYHHKMSLFDIMCVLDMYRLSIVCKMYLLSDEGNKYPMSIEFTIKVSFTLRYVVQFTSFCKNIQLFVLLI